MALALFALSVDLIWGYTGLLSLGQGLYFGLGAYAVGYSLKLQQAAHAAGKPLLAGPDMAMPDFMEYCRLPGVPAWIAPLINIWLALGLAVLLPLAVATIFGLVTFRLRIKGVFFALITQALVLAVYTLVVNQQPYTGGVVGMTYLAKLELFGHKFVMADMYFLVTTVLVVCFLACAILVHTKFGQILTAIRVPVTTGEKTAYLKVKQSASGFAIAGVAVRLRMDGQKCAAAYVGITGVADRAYRAAEVEKVLVGKAIDLQTIAAAAEHAADGIDPLSDIHASDEYRGHLSRVYTRRAIAAALEG